MTLERPSPLRLPELGEAGRLDYLASGFRPWLLLTLLALALYLPGIATLPPIDRDEARYIQASRQMLETGDFLDIRFQNEARNKKPAGIYWLQAGAVALLSNPQSTAVWPYRLISVLGATAAVLLSFFFGAAIFDRRTALAASALGAASLDAVFAAHVATTDAVLLATAVAAQGGLGLIYLGYRRGEAPATWHAVVFWTALGLAVLVKGPVVPAVAALTVLTLTLYDRQRRGWLRRLCAWWGVPLMLALFLPWLVAIELATGGAFLRDSLGHDFWGKVASTQESHGAPALYYLALLPATFWPGSMLLGLAAVWAWRERHLPATRFLLAWLVPYWLLLELLPTKLPHYVLPLYPALALIAARALIAHAEEGFLRRPGWWLRGPAILWLLVVLAIAVALGFAMRRLASPPLTAATVTALVAAMVPALVAGLALWRIRMPEPGQRAGLGLVNVLVLMGIVASAFTLGGVLPTLDLLWPSRAAALLVETARRAAPALGPNVAVAGDAEPSLVFLLGTATLIEAPEAAAADLHAGRVGLALIETRDAARFQAALKTAGDAGVALGRAAGVDYSNGHALALTLYRAQCPRTGCAR